MLVVGQIAGVDLGSAMSRNQRLKCLIEKCGIWCVWTDSTGCRESLSVDGRADSNSAHAISMPWLCYAGFVRHSWPPALELDSTAKAKRGAAVSPTLKLSREDFELELRRGTFDVEIDGMRVGSIDRIGTEELLASPGATLCCLEQAGTEVTHSLSRE